MGHLVRCLTKKGGERRIMGGALHISGYSRIKVREYRVKQHVESMGALRWMYSKLQFLRAS